MPPRIPLLLLLFGLLALPAPAGAEDLVQTLPVTHPGRLRIQLDRGSVDVMMHAEASVFVEAQARGLGASSVDFEIVRAGNDVVLRARTEEWVDWLSAGPLLEVQVLVPPFFEVVNESKHALVTHREAVELSYPTRAVGNRTR